MLKSCRKQTIPALLACVLLASAAMGEEAPKHFDVPAGNLVSALQALEKQSDAEFVYQAAQLKGVRTKGVSGMLTVQEAVRKLIEGTQVRMEVDATTGAMLIFSASAPPAMSLEGLEARPRSKEQQREFLQLAKGEKAEARAEKNAENQSADEPSAAKDARSESDKISELLVRGSRIGLVNQGVIPRGEREAVYYTVIDREDIERSGAIDIASLFQRAISQSTTYGTGAQSIADLIAIGLGGSGGGVPREALNIRGFGSGQTIVLINGRRTFGGETEPADINRIPLSAIERIEIMPGSASAMYGGGATAGMVNVVLRKDYSGMEVTERFGVSSRGAAAQNNVSLVSGRAWNDGATRLTWTLDHSWREAMTMAQGPFNARALGEFAPDSARAQTLVLGTALALNSFVLPRFSQPLGTIRVNPFTSTSSLGIPLDPTARYAVVPSGSTGEGLTPASFNATAGQFNLGTDNILAAGTLISPDNKISFNAEGEHRIGDTRFGLYSELGFSYQRLPTQRYRNFGGNISISATNPLNPFRTNVTPGFVGRQVFVNMNPVDVPPATQDGTLYSERAVLGLKREAADPAGWSWLLDASWERYDNRGTANNMDLAFFSVRGALYNPFRDVVRNPHPLSIWDENFQHAKQQTITEIAVANFRANGQVYRLPTGAVRASIGAEVRREDFFFERNTINAGRTALIFGESQDVIEEGSRQASSVFTELTVPFGGTLKNSAISRLDLSIASRLEKYDDFSLNESSLAALKFVPVDGLALRASYSEGYNPPTQVQLHRPVDTQLIDATVGFDPLRGDTAHQVPLQFTTGGDPDLRPERSQTYNFGLLLGGRKGGSFSGSIDWFRIRRFDEVSDDVISLIFAYPEVFGTRVTRAAPTAEDAALGWPGIITAIDVRPFNLSEVRSDGLDVKMGWTRTLADSSTLTVDLAATYTRSFDLRPVPVLPSVDRVGVLAGPGNPPIKLRGNVSAYLDRGPWTFGITGRYIHSYMTSSTELTPENAEFFVANFDGASIPRSVEFDLDLAYRIAPDPAGLARGWSNLLSGTTCSLRINNVLDAEPPFRSDFNAFYSRFNDPRMRFIVASIRKAF